MIRFAYLSAKKTFFLPKTLFHFIQRVSASFYLLIFFFFFNKTKCVYISAEEKSDVRKIKNEYSWWSKNRFGLLRTWKTRKWLKAMNRCRVTRVQVHMSSTCSLSHSEKWISQTLLEEQHWGDKDTQPLPVLLHYNSIRTCLARKVKHPQHKLVGVCFTSRYRILFGHTCGKGFHFERLSFGSFICDMLSETGNENVIQII